MQVLTSDLAGVLIFVPQVHRDDRGFFSRTFDVDVAAAHGLDGRMFRQDSQSRTIGRGALRGMHSRSGAGEAKLVRCGRGAVHDVIVDIRPDSKTFGRSLAFRLDDVEMRHLYVPTGFLHGFQVLTDAADICYRIDRPHAPNEDLAVHHADRDLAIAWPLPVGTVSARDDAAGSFAELRAQLGR
ncbi:dTDP-4-dehydrorhamnose 3,5-epimerase [Nakamurella panacisegetis]|uniref:dTDP-4-dehydrorhamnose 3,5-epimerase n=1 Tax=Nakamurella panacisegetis TaxID=1090615 RepID=A0A1H0LZT9_9ACTN|nr:dTDP-4-dehydrorhamnose 3,5-epimerase [Nakamurella panacisegetis]SDO73450.1 dTDP-4-dehydrorhamnose 3,5-epimerase [Nakamurella panacisegetis]